MSHVKHTAHWLSIVPMEINYLAREEIDKTKWDSCVHYANNGNVFGYMWYLDHVAKEWDALVEGDYESVFPLVWRENFWGRKHLIQPPWMRELGLFSIHVLSKPRIKAFIDAIPKEFRRISVHLNEQNFLPEASGFVMSPRTNYQLLLQPAYEEIADRFSSEWFTQLAEAEKNKLITVSNVKPERVADFFRKYSPRRPDREARSHALLRIMYNILHRGWGFASGVQGGDGELLAVNFFIYSHSKVLSLVPVVSPKGEEKGALELLFHMLIKTHAGKPLLLDLNDDGSSGFVQGMGAQPNSYFKLERQ